MSTPRDASPLKQYLLSAAVCAVLALACLCIVFNSVDIVTYHPSDPAANGAVGSAPPTVWSRWLPCSVPVLSSQGWSTTLFPASMI